MDPVFLRHEFRYGFHTPVLPKTAPPKTINRLLIFDTSPAAPGFPSRFPETPDCLLYRTPMVFRISFHSAAQETPEKGRKKITYEEENGLRTEYMLRYLGRQIKIATQHPVLLARQRQPGSGSEKTCHEAAPRRRRRLLGPSGRCASTSLSCGSSLSLST